jgi:hypothetical protein
VTTPQQDLARIARAVVDASSYLTLATADRAGPRLYRASVSELWLLDGFDQRLPVELEDLGDEA